MPGLGNGLTLGDRDMLRKGRKSRGALLFLAALVELLAPPSKMPFSHISSTDKDLR